MNKLQLWLLDCLYTFLLKFDAAEAARRGAEDRLAEIKALRRDIHA